MRVVFLELDTERSWAVASLGPAAIAAYLRAHGHEAELLRVAPDETPEHLAECINRSGAGLVGVSLTARQWGRARELLGAVRPLIDAPLLAGGLHATFSASSVLASPAFDYVCLGEGEEAVLELAGALEEGAPVPAMRNIWPRGAARPELRPPIAPLDSLPFLARDLLGEQHGVVHVTTQRGCPFSCSYCAARTFDDLYAPFGGYVRRRSPEHVIAELEELRDGGPLHYVIFLDDTFTAGRSWVRRYAALHRARVGVGFSLHARPETVDRELLGLLAEAGCKHVVYGVESGSPRVRRDILKRPGENARIVDTFRWTREAGMLATANYMLGLPGETRAEVCETLALHDELAPDDFGHFVFYPYRGTALFELCRERGYLPDDHDELPYAKDASVLRLPELSALDIEELSERFLALRDRDHLRRSGATLTAAQRRQLSAELRARAATS